MADSRWGRLSDPDAWRDCLSRIILCRPAMAARRQVGPDLRRWRGRVLHRRSDRGPAEFGSDGTDSGTTQTGRSASRSDDHQDKTSANQRVAELKATSWSKY